MVRNKEMPQWSDIAVILAMVLLVLISINIDSCGALEDVTLRPCRASRLEQTFQGHRENHLSLF